MNRKKDKTARAQAHFVFFFLFVAVADTSLQLVDKLHDIIPFW